MGLPGSGKTTLAKIIANKLNADWFNADKIRGLNNDWDFSKKGIIRQVKRMAFLAKKSKKRFVVADFICPLKLQMDIFKPNYVVWMDTIKKSRYPKINKIFKKPKKYNLRVTSKNIALWQIPILDEFKKYKWNNKKETAQMLGRYQPWHEGHKKLFEKIILRNQQVNIQIKDVKGINDNPFTFFEIKNIIRKSLFHFRGRIKITKVPNISNIFYGRTVGYNIEKINLDKNLQLISATKIRRKLRRAGKL